MHSGDAVTGFFIIAVGIFLYFAPWIVALNRQHKNTLAIFITNLFLGWTFLGWVAALIWACTSNTRAADQKRPT
mgnify:CR=1 FL=1